MDVTPHFNAHGKVKKVKNSSGVDEHCSYHRE